MHVTGLWRYPVKSMGGEACESLELEERGAVGDRLYAVRDAEGRFGSGKWTRRFRRIDGLPDFTATYDKDLPSIRFPDGTVRRADDPGLDTALSDALDLPVGLAREESVSHFDAGPVHIVTLSDLDWLRGLLPEAGIDERRCRPNLVVDDRDGGMRHEDWIGKGVAVGAARLRIVEPTRRCVMVNDPREGLPKAPEILRAIAQDRNLQLGLYAEVVVPGRVDRGNLLAVCDDWRGFAKAL